MSDQVNKKVSEKKVDLRSPRFLVAAALGFLFAGKLFAKNSPKAQLRQPKGIIPRGKNETGART